MGRYPAVPHICLPGKDHYSMIIQDSSQNIKDFYPMKYSLWHLKTSIWSIPYNIRNGSLELILTYSTIWSTPYGKNKSYGGLGISSNGDWRQYWEPYMEYTINSPLELILSRAANCCGTWAPETNSRILKVYSTLSDMSRHLRVTPTLFWYFLTFLTGFGWCWTFLHQFWLIAHPFQQ